MAKFIVKVLNELSVGESYGSSDALNYWTAPTQVKKNERKRFWLKDSGEQKFIT